MNTAIDSAVTETLLYHEQTKHHFHRYARSAGFLDWANQPNPFRFYEGVTAVTLPLLQKDPPAWPKHSASDAPTKPLRRAEGPRAGTWLCTKGAATSSRILPAKPSPPFLSYRSGFRRGSPFVEARELCA